MNDSRAWRHALAIIAGTTLLRLVIGGIIPLFPDETYYWDWSRVLRAGYFDHPPMIAVLIRAGTAIFGYHAFGVRVFPILAGSGAALAIAMTARALAGDAAARITTLAFACMPIAAVGLVLATPDSPMLCAIAWAMYFVVRALNAPTDANARERRRWWLAAGVTMGLAMGSKYTSVLFPAAIVIAFVGHPRLQNRFGESGPYLAVIVAALVLVPNLWWNGTHDLVSFRFQLGHGLGAPTGGVAGALNREVQLIGGQILAASPVLFYFFVRAVKRGFDPTPDGIRMTLAVIPVCFVLFFMYSATRRSVEINWPAISFLPAAVLLGTEAPDTRRGEKWLKGGLVCGAVLSLLIIVHALYPIIPVPARRDQIAKAFGWELLADKVDRRRMFVSSRQGFGRFNLYFGAERYQDASELAFHLSEHPRVFSLNLTGRQNQYDLWGTFPERADVGSSLMLVLDDDGPNPPVIRKLIGYFQRIDEGESVALVRGEDVAARKRLWFLQGWSGGWPPPRVQPLP